MLAAGPRQAPPPSLYLPLVRSSRPAAATPLPLVAQLGGTPQAVAAWGRYAYVAYYRRLEVLDLSDPTSPWRVGVAAPVEERFVRGLAAGSGMAYLVTCTDCDDGGQPETSYLHVLDAHDPAAPQWVGSLRFEHVVGNPAVRGGHVYLSSNDGLVVVDVSDPTRPWVAGTVPDVPWLWALADDHLVAVGWEGGLFRYSLADPAEPVLAGGLGLKGRYVEGLVSTGRLVVVLFYNTGADSLEVIDTAGRQPVSLGSLTIEGTGGGTGVWAGDRLFLPWSTGLVAVDLTDPSRPAVVGQADVAHGVVAIAGTATHAVVATSRGPVMLFDAPNGSGLRLTGRYGVPLGGDFYAAAAADGRLFVHGGAPGAAGSGSGLVDIIDVSDPGAPPHSEAGALRTDSPRSAWLAIACTLAALRACKSWT